MPLTLAGPAALLISECQHGIVAPGGGGFAGLVDEVARRGVIPRLAALAHAFRTSGLPVFPLTVAPRPDFSAVKPN